VGQWTAKHFLEDTAELQKLIEPRRLPNVSRCAEFRSLEAIFRSVRRAQDKHRHLGALSTRAEVFENLAAGPLRQIQIKNNEIGTERLTIFDLVDELDRSLSISFHDNVTLDSMLVESFTNEGDIGGIVLDEQYAPGVLAVRRLSSLVRPGV